MPRSSSLLSLALCGSLAFTGASAAFAAATPKPGKKKITPKTSDSQPTEKEATSGIQGASQFARGSHKIGIDALYTPLSDYALSYGGSGSYNLSPQINTGFAVLMGTSTLSKSETDNGVETTANAKIVGSAYYAYGRYFLGNSFNATGGLGLRSATITYDAQVGSGSAIALKGKVEIQSIVLPVYIGNRWTFDSGFTIGCDWIGAMIAITGSAKSSLEGNLDNQTIKNFNQEFLDTGNSLAHKSSLTLFLTSVGWAF